MLGPVPATYIINAQKRESFTEELEFEPRLEDQIGICWVNQLEEDVPGRKNSVCEVWWGGAWHFGGDCNKMQEAGA